MEALQKGGLNDLVIKLATVNGTGSASANSLLMRAIFRMGIPVMGRNYFPSNIQGLPTWFEIRVNHRGFLSRSGRVDLMVAMNAETYRQDLAELSPGGTLIYDSTWLRGTSLVRDDVEIIGVPLAQMCNDAFSGVRSRILMKNISYVGVLAALLDIDMDILRVLLEETFAAKPKLVDINLEAINLGFSYAKEHFACPLEMRLEKLEQNSEHILIDGNTAAALGCVYAGASFAAWYPITPSTSLMDGFRGFCEYFRKEPDTGKNRFCILQAEDELGAIGMTIGASWSGARAFTSTSGPGISLMSEFLGFAYFAEVPLVLFDVQRAGPSTGMPTRTQQSDLLACAFASHGDTRHVLLFPADPAECFSFAVKAFDLAERLQTPVIVLSDLEIGMNDWMCPKLEWDDSYKPDRGKVLDADALEKLPQFLRYHDEDGDGICYRTYPGVHPTGGYFTRGSGHNEYARYTEKSDEYLQVVDRLTRKFETAAKLAPEAVLLSAAQATTWGVISIGSCDGAVRETVDLLNEKGLYVDYLRVRAFPFGEDVQAFLDNHERVFVVEQNRDAQLKSLLTLEMNVEKDRLFSILHYDGTPLDCPTVYTAIYEQVKQSAAA
jgi:2-oxoglutarate/2-oxoacid ferredoxin oxidoreductase subunit alpha